MNRARFAILVINVLGGIAVLGSYVHGVQAFPDPLAALWGQVPEAWRPVYTVSMFLATAGYLVFGPFLLFFVDPPNVRLAGGLSYPWLIVPFLLILVPSAAWMPLMERYVAAPSDALWLAIRVVLALVGLGSLALLTLLAGMWPRGRFWAASLVGAVAFLFQTGVLDALVWTAWYRG